MAEQDKEHWPFGRLLSSLSQGVTRILRQEIDLAKAEISRKIKKGSKDLVFLIAGGFVVYSGFLVLMAGAILALWAVLPLWASALVVGALLIILGSALALKGLSGIKHSGLKPDRTIETLKEGVKWVKEQV